MRNDSSTLNKYCYSNVCSLEKSKIIINNNKWELAVAHPQGGSLSTVSGSNWNLEMLVTFPGIQLKMWGLKNDCKVFF